MNSITIGIMPNKDVIRAMTAEERQSALLTALGEAQIKFREAAIIYMEMERAGDDISKVPLHIRRYLRRIATDQMLPEVMRLPGRLREATAKLPVIDQQKIAEGYIRPPAEQRVIPYKERKLREGAGRPHVEIEIDKNRGGAIIEGRFVSKKKLLEILSQI